MTQPTPIHRFLGEVDLALGPFGLLGLPVGPCGGARIDAAMRRQLGRLDRHPQGSSPDADEVRLALHVAAAQLRDRAVLEEILADLAWRAPASPVDCGPGLPAAAAQSTGSPAGLPALARSAAQSAGVVMRQAPSPRADRREFERMALWVLADAGGWNRSAQRRIAALAHAWSLGTVELTECLSALGSGAAAVTARGAVAPGRSGADAAGSTVAAADEEPSAPPVQALVRRWGLLALLIVMVVSSVFMIRAALELNAARRRAADAALGREAVVPGLEGALPGTEAVPPPVEPQPVVRDVALTRPSEAGTARSDPRPQRHGLEPVADANTVEWAVFARAQLDRAAPAGATLAEVLRDAARSAIVNAAAARLQRSDAQATAEARRLIATLSEESAMARREAEAPPSLARLTSPAEPPDGGLALQLLSNRRNAGAAIDALRKRRVGRETLGPADCDAVAELAFFAPGAELRGAARLVVMDESRNTAMLAAVLDLLAKNPPAGPASDLIQELTRRPLPPVSDPSWPLRARAAVLAKLAEEIGSERDAELDDLAETLAGAYEATAEALAPGPIGAPRTAGPIDGTSAGARPDDAAARVFGLWRDRAEVFRSDVTFDRRFEAILLRRQQRLMLASGPIQRFVAEQGSAVEMMGLVVAAERPSQAARVDQLLGEWARDRRDAPHGMAQVRAGERAVARLWLAMMNQADLTPAGKEGR